MTDRRSVLKTMALSAGAGLVGRGRLGFAQAAAADPMRPVFHLQPERGWMNDPCAPMYWRGEYHMFHQYNPHAAVWGDMHWAHAVSKDMVHWRRVGVALAPTPGGPDAQGCFTGSALLGKGRPAIIYTGVQTVTQEQATLSDGNNIFRETQCLARASDDALTTWTKEPRAVIASPPEGMRVTGFRDPAPFRYRGEQYLLVASGEAKKGGMVLLYRAGKDAGGVEDLTRWEYLHPMAEGKWSGVEGKNPVDTGEMWECPDFFELDGRHVLIYSTQGKTIWQVGELDGSLRFTAQKTGRLDYGSYYAPKTQVDARGRRILWGWIPERRPEAEYSRAGWSGMMSLPRVLRVKGDELFMEPAAEVERLRGRRNAKAGELPSTRQEFRCVLQEGEGGTALPYRIGDVVGTLVEIRAEAAQSAEMVRVDETEIAIGEKLPPEVEVRVFVDGSVMEIFIDRRFCVTRRFYAREGGKTVVTVMLPGRWRVNGAASFSMDMTGS